MLGMKLHSIGIVLARMKSLKKIEKSFLSSTNNSSTTSLATKTACHDTPISISAEAGHPDTSKIHHTSETYQTSTPEAQ
jgi:hypothetical protein